MIEMKYNRIFVAILACIALVFIYIRFLPDKWTLWDIIIIDILIIFFLWLARYFYLFKVILNDKGITIIHDFLPASVCKKSKFIPWGKVRFKYDDPGPQTPYRFVLYSENAYMYLTIFFLVPYKKALAYIVEKLNKIEYKFDEDTRYELDKKGILAMAEEDKKAARKVRIQDHLDSIKFGATIGIAMAAIFIYCGSLPAALGAIGVAIVIVVVLILFR